MGNRRFPWFATVLLALIVPMLTPALASAHPELLQARPQASSTVSQASRQITLSFSESISDSFFAISIQKVGEGLESLTTRLQNSKEIVAVPEAALSDGQYVVAWRIVGKIDGHQLSGAFGFGVNRPAPDVLPVETTSAQSFAIRTGMKALAYLAVLGYVGLLILGRISPGGWSGAISDFTGSARVGAAVVVVVAVSQVADAAGAVASWSPAIWLDYIFDTRAGQLRLAALFVLLSVVSYAPIRPRAAALLGAAALGLIASSGHALSSDWPVIAVPIAWLHLLAASVWISGVGLLAWFAAKSREDLHPGANQYALVIGGAFAIAVATGSLSGLIEVGSLARLLDSNYGVTLSVKITVVALTIGVAYSHRRHVMNGSDVTRAAAIKLEVVLALAIVVLASALVSMRLPPSQAAGAADRVTVPSDD